MTNRQVTSDNNRKPELQQNAPWRHAIANALDARIRNEIQEQRLNNINKRRREYVCAQAKLAFRDLSNHFHVNYHVNVTTKSHQSTSPCIELTRMLFRTQPSTTMNSKRAGSGVIVYAELDLLWRPHDDTVDGMTMQDIHNVHLSCSLESESNAVDANITTQSGLIPTFSYGDRATMSMIVDISGLPLEGSAECVSTKGITLGLQLLWNQVPAITSLPGQAHHPQKEQHRSGDFLALLHLSTNVLVVPQRNLQAAIMADAATDNTSTLQSYTVPAQFYECRIPHEVMVDVANCSFHLEAWLVLLNEALEGTLHRVVGKFKQASQATMTLTLLAYPSWEYISLVGLVKRNLPDMATIVGVDEIHENTERLSTGFTLRA